jgi:hypothetical protein
VGRAGLAAIETIIDASGAAPVIEAMLPAGVRHRQLTARTLLTGMMLALDDRRPAYLTEARAALTALPGADQARLGVTEDWHGRPHQLTYRQTEHTFGLITKALSKDEPGGTPPADLAAFCDTVLEASIPARYKDPASPDASSSLAADWTDVETWSRPPRHGSTECADPEAHWGHRNSNLPGPKGEMFFGYYLSILNMVRDEDGPPVPELARRMTAGGCDHDPARALAAVLLAMAASGIKLGDVIDDSGYAHRDAGAWAIPLRQAGAQLVQDLHPADRGPRGTHHGAVIANGNLYCPCTPKPLLEPGPLPPGAPAGQVAATTSRPPSSPVTSPAGTPPTTPTATTAPPAPPPPGRSAARSAPIRCCSAATGPRSSRPLSTRPPAAPSAPSPCHRRSQPRPGRNTTTPQRPGGGPTSGAPAPNGPTPPSRTPPATTSPAAGSESPQIS